jgi:Fe2+ transport system protein FeoA
VSSTATAVTALSEARVGDAGVVERIDLPEEVSNYLAHLGFLPGTAVEVLRRAPAGDPTVYRIDGVEVGLRNQTARHIYLRLSGLAPVSQKISAAVTPPVTHKNGARR